MKQRRHNHRSITTAGVGLLAIAGAATANPILELVPGSGPGVTITVRVRNIGPVPAAGWQAFLEFDSSRLSLVSGSYDTTHFGLPLTNPAIAHGNQIDLAAGINGFVGQQPTSADQDVAHLVFAPVGTGCMPQVRVRPSSPPTRLTDLDGVAIGTLLTISPWSNCPADFNRSGSLEIQDIFDFLNAWFAGTCRADFDGASGLQVSDIFAFLNAWFGGCS
jgi:hypothetical protein